MDRPRRVSAPDAERESGQGWRLHHYRCARGGISSRGDTRGIGGGLAESSVSGQARPRRAATAGPRRRSPESGPHRRINPMTRVVLLLLALGGLVPDQTRDTSTSRRGTGVIAGTVVGDDADAKP